MKFCVGGSIRYVSLDNTEEIEEEASKLLTLEHPCLVAALNYKLVDNKNKQTTFHETMSLLPKLNFLLKNLLSKSFGSNAF